MIRLLANFSIQNFLTENSKPALKLSATTILHNTVCWLKQLHSRWKGHTLSNTIIRYRISQNLFDTMCVALLSLTEEKLEKSHSHLWSEDSECGYDTWHCVYYNGKVKCNLHEPAWHHSHLCVCQDGIISDFHLSLLLSKQHPSFSSTKELLLF